MKKGLYILTLLLVIGTTVRAQVESPRSCLEIGIAGGMNLNRMEFQPSIRQKLQQGINGGISARYTSEKYFSMICAAQIEVNFAQRGMHEDFDDGTSNYYSRLLNYIEVPFFAHVSWGREKKGFQFFLNLGPQFGFFINESEKYNGNWETANRPSTIRPLYGKEIENKFEYGIAGGLGLEYKSKIGNFFIEGRYFYGLSDIFGNSKTDDFGRSANTTITARIGYSFTIFNKDFE
ncbi:MAG: PorT family protein [Bacteroidaceae bacterium]|nr:PorT family protein [Bacteroidaceae bacterium]